MGGWVGLGWAFCTAPLGQGHGPHRRHHHHRLLLLALRGWNQTESFASIDSGRTLTPGKIMAGQGTGRVR